MWHRTSVFECVQDCHSTSAANRRRHSGNSGYYERSDVEQQAEPAINQRCGQPCRRQGTFALNMCNVVFCDMSHELYIDNCTYVQMSLGRERGQFETVLLYKGIHTGTALDNPKRFRCFNPYFHV